MSSKDPDDVRTGALLNPTAAFGLDSNVRNNVQHVDENVFVFPVGRHFCSFDLESREMQFLMEIDRVKRVTAMTVSQNRKYLAVIELLHEHDLNQFSIFNLQTNRRVRTIMIGGEVCKSSTISCIAFSGCSKYLLVQNGAPDWMLTCWRWYNGKMTAQAAVDTEVDYISFNPGDSSMFMTTGPKLMKYWRMDKQSEAMSFQDLAPKERAFSGTYTHHAWLVGDQVAVTTSLGKILIFHAGDLKSVVPAVEEGLGHISIHGMARGFITIANSYELLLYELSLHATTNDDGDNKSDQGGPATTNPYALLKRFRLDINPRWASLSISEESMLVSNMQGDIGKLVFSNLDGGSEPAFELICSGFHKGAVTGMDACSQRPLLVTCGSDRTVRIWNYLDKTCRLKKKFDVELSSVSFHPSGFYVLVGMADKLRLFNVAVKDLVQLREFHVPGCKMVRFSHGGHMFAAINKAVVQVYSTYSTQAQASVLKGHQGQVTNLTWSQNDLRLATCSAAGEVFEWKMDTMSRDHARDCVMKTCQYTAVEYNWGAHAVIASGSDGRIKHLVAGNLEFETRLEDVVAPALALARDDRMLFATTDQGTLRSYVWVSNPTLANPQDGTFSELWLHKSSATHLLISADQNFCFSCDEVGTIFVCDLRFMVDGNVQDKLPVDRGLDLTLLAREELDELHATTAELQGRLESTISQMEYNLMSKEKEAREKEQKFAKEIETMSAANAKLEDELRRVKEIMGSEMNERVMMLERSHMQAAEELENLYEKKLAKEARRYKDLQQDMLDEKFKMDDRLRELSIAHEQEMKVQALKLDERKKAEEARLKDLEAEKHDIKAHADEMLLQTEEDTDHDIENVKRRFGEQYARTHEQNQRLKADNALMQRGMDKLQRQVDEQTALVAEKAKENRMLELEIKEMDDVIEDLRGQIQDRNNMIEGKESSINAEKSKVRDLEKQRFVLNYKVNHLQAEKEPRETKLALVQDKLKDIDKDLQGQMYSLEKQRLYCREVNGRISAVTAEVKTLRQMVRDRDIYIKGFAHDLDRVMELPHGRREGQREDALRYLHRVYVHGLEEKGQKVLESGATEMQRQHEYLERKNKYLSRKAQHADHWSAVTARRARQENALILTDLSTLQRKYKKEHNELEELRVKNRELESSLDREQKRVKDPNRPVSPAAHSHPTHGLTIQEELLAAAEAATSSGPSGFRSNGASRPASGRTAGTARQGALMKGVTTRALNELVSMERERIMELVGHLDNQHAQIQEQHKQIEFLKQQIGIYSGMNSQDQSAIASAAGYWDYDEGRLRPDSAVSAPVVQRSLGSTREHEVDPNVAQGEASSSGQRPFSAMHPPATLQRLGSVRERPPSANVVPFGAKPPTRSGRPQTALPLRSTLSGRRK